MPKPWIGAQQCPSMLIALQTILAVRDATHQPFDVKLVPQQEDWRVLDFSGVQMTGSNRQAAVMTSILAGLAMNDTNCGLFEVGGRDSMVYGYIAMDAKESPDQPGHHIYRYIAIY